MVKVGQDSQFETFEQPLVQNEMGEAEQSKHCDVKENLSSP